MGAERDLNFTNLFSVAVRLEEVALVNLSADFFAVRSAESSILFLLSFFFLFQLVFCLVLLIRLFLSPSSLAMMVRCCRPVFPSLAPLIFFLFVFPPTPFLSLPSAAEQQYRFLVRPF